MVNNWNATSTVDAIAMSLLRYLKRAGGLPDPRGPLSSTLPGNVIAAANREVEKELKTKKRGQYKKYTPSQRFQIGRYSSQHGAAAAARHFSRIYEHEVSESTVKSIKNYYISEVRKRPRSDDGEEFASLPTKKRGRKLLLGEDLDSKVQLYLKKVRESGGAVSARIAMAAARGIVLKCQPSMLVENGGPFEATKYWAHSLLKRMKYVQRKSTTAKSKYTVANFAQKRKEFLQDIYDIVAMEEIPPELVLNWDQTGIKLVPSSSWTMERQGKKRVEMVGVNDKRQITALFCGTMLGDFLSIRGRLVVATLSFPFQKTGTLPTHPNTGQLSLLCSTTSIM